MQLGHAVRPTILPLFIRVLTCKIVQCPKDTCKNGIKKAVTGLVSVPVSKTLVIVARWPRDEGTCRCLLVDDCPSNFVALNTSHRTF